MELKDRVALVTGAASGMGKASAELLARHGAKVGGVDIDGEGLTRAMEEIVSAGGEALAAPGDVSVAEDMRRTVEQVVARWGRVDIVFANAGFNGLWAPLEEFPEQQWHRTHQTNLMGAFLTLKYAIPHLKVRGGSVIITSSINGSTIFSNPGSAVYCAAKAGLVALAKAAAVELAGHRVRVNVICPGWISTGHRAGERREGGPARRETPRVLPIPLTGGQKGKPEQVAQLVLFLASDASDHITGAQIVIDGGESFVE